MARDRYLLDDTEESINNNESIEEVLKQTETPKSKWQNFWFYHKWQVLIAILILGVIAFTVREAVSRVDPDYQVSILSEYTYPDSITQTIQTEFEKYGEDLNQDGQVIVQINNYAISHTETDVPADPNMQMAGYTRFAGDLGTGESMIFLVDDANFKIQQDSQQVFSYLDGSIPKEGAEDYENMRVEWKNSPILSALKFPVDDGLTEILPETQEKLAERLSLSLRSFKGTSIEKDPDKQAYYEASVRLFDKIIGK